MTEDGQTVETWERVNSGNQKYRESNKHGVDANRRHPSVLIVILSPQLGLRNRGSTQASALWTPVTLPAAKLRPPARNDRPGPPTATLVGVGGSGDQSGPGRALHDTRGPFHDGPQGWGGPFIGEALRPGYPILPDADCVGGRPHPRPGAGDIGQGLTK